MNLRALERIPWTPGRGAGRIEVQPRGSPSMNA